jgi:hypothetical protein
MPPPVAEQLLKSAPDGSGSTADLAALTGWPVVLVVDARRQGASAVALIGGFARHDPELPLAGVIFNRVAGPRHRALLETALARHVPGVPCLGSIPQDPALALAERHLGLVPAGERAGAETVIEHAATAVSAALDINALLALSVYAQYEARGDAFVPQYLDLLRAGGSMAPEALGELLGHVRPQQEISALQCALLGLEKIVSGLGEIAPRPGDYADVTEDFSAPGR